MVKNVSAKAGDIRDGLIPGSGRSPGERNGNPLQYSCLENFVDKEVWQAIVHGVIRSQTQLSDYHSHTHVHWVSDAIQPSHPLSPSSSPVLNLSQHQDIFPRVSFLHQVAKVLELQLQHQSFQWKFRTDFRKFRILGLTGLISLQSKRLSRVFSNTTVQKHQLFGAQPSSQSNSHIHTWPLEKP